MRGQIKHTTVVRIPFETPIADRRRRTNIVANLFPSSVDPPWLEVSSEETHDERGSAAYSMALCIESLSRAIAMTFPWEAGPVNPVHSIGFLFRPFLCFRVARRSFCWFYLSLGKVRGRHRVLLANFDAEHASIFNSPMVLLQPLLSLYGSETTTASKVSRCVGGRRHRR